MEHASYLAAASSAEASPQQHLPELSLDELLALENPPVFNELAKVFAPATVLAAVAKLAAPARIKFAKKWCDPDGLPPGTARDADRALGRLLLATSPKKEGAQVMQAAIRSPRAQLTRGKKRVRKTAQSEIPQAPERPVSAARSRNSTAASNDLINKIGHQVRAWRLDDVEPTAFFGLASLAELKTALMLAPRQLLQQMGDAIGLPSRTSVTNMRLELLVWAGEQHEQRQVFESASAGGQASPAPAFERGRQPQAKKGREAQATKGAQHAYSEHLDSDDKTSSSSDSEQEDSDSEEASGDEAHSLDDKERRAWRERQFAGWRVSESQLAAPSHQAAEGYQFVRGAVMSVVGKKASSKTVRRVMETLREAAQSRESRIGVERFVAAMAKHMSEEEPRGLSVRSGKYFGQHKPVASRDPVSPWADIEVSYNFAQEGSLLSDDWVEEGVVNLSTQKKTLIIELPSSILTRLHSTPSIYGWAELASGAGAAAMEDIWKPYLSWREPQGTADDVMGELSRKTARVIANCAAEITICSHIGARKLCATLLLTLIATQSLIEMRRTSEETWPRMVRQWLQDLHRQARVDVLLSSSARSAYALAALSVPSPTPTTQASSASPAGNQRRQTPSKKEAKGVLQRLMSDPATFVFCGVCSKPSHCLWDCRLVANKIRQRVSQGTSAQQAAEFWIKRTRDKYGQRGPEFLAAFEARPDKTREALIAKVTT